MNFEKRLQRLERRLERTRVTETAVLYFEDGTTATIPCDGPSLARLFGDVPCEATPPLLKS